MYGEIVCFEDFCDSLLGSIGGVFDCTRFASTHVKLLSFMDGGFDCLCLYTFVKNTSMYISLRSVYLCLFLKVLRRETHSKT